jgi:hypothetical protein
MDFFGRNSRIDAAIVVRPKISDSSLAVVIQISQKHRYQVVRVLVVIQVYGRELVFLGMQNPGVLAFLSQGMDGDPGYLS